MSTETPSAPEPARTISLVMPVFDEEASIAGAIQRAGEGLAAVADAFEIIVIDDGSTDRTGEIADAMAADDARIRVLHNERNRNYGYSLARGIAAARYEWVLHDGADLPLAPEDFGAFVARLGEADVVVASRHDRRAHVPWRQLTSWVNNRLLRLLYAPRTRDLNFVQFYRRAYAQSVSLRSSSPAFVCPELIMRAEHRGLRVVEVAAEFQRREHGRGHFGRPKDVLWTLRDMLYLRVWTWFRGWDA